MESVKLHPFDLDEPISPVIAEAGKSRPKKFLCRAIPFPGLVPWRADADVPASGENTALRQFQSPVLKRFIVQNEPQSQEELAGPECWSRGCTEGADVTGKWSRSPLHPRAACEIYRLCGVGEARKRKVRLFGFAGASPGCSRVRRGTLLVCPGFVPGCAAIELQTLEIIDFVCKPGARSRCRQQMVLACGAIDAGDDAVLA